MKILEYTEHWSVYEKRKKKKLFTTNEATGDQGKPNFLFQNCINFFIFLNCEQGNDHIYFKVESTHPEKTFLHK